MKIETLKAMATRHHPLQALLVTFAPEIDGIRMLSVLKSYADKGYIRFESELLILAILASRDWGRTGRKLTVYFVAGQLWDEDGFLQLAERGIENIDVASDSPLNVLQSSRQKKREDAMAQIAAAVLTPEVRNEISEWGLKVRFHALEYHGLHSMCIAVDDNHTTVFSIFLDGWSGNLLTPSNTIICNCSSYMTIQQELRKMLAKYLEKVTA